MKSEKTVHFFLSIFAPFLPFGFIITATLTHTHATDSSIVQCVCVNLTALHWLPMLAMDNSFSSVASASSSSLRRCILSLPPPFDHLCAPPGSTFSSLPAGGHFAAGDCTEMRRWPPPLPPHNRNRSTECVLCSVHQKPVELTAASEWENMSSQDVMRNRAVCNDAN